MGFNRVITCAFTSLSKAPLKPKTISINTSGIRLATSPIGIGDTLKITTDRSLQPDFLHSLLSCKDNNEIKNKILEAMGYTRSELLKIEPLYNSSFNFAFDFEKGVLNTTNVPLSKEQTIAIIRHEFDHFDKIAKLIKSVGYDETMKALDEAIIANNLRPITKNKQFWILMSQDAKTEGFDAPKYLEALRTYIFSPGQKAKNYYEYYIDWNKYATNLFEADAYKIQSNVLSKLGVDSTTLYNSYVTEFNKINKLIDQLSVEDKSKILKELKQCAVLINSNEGINLLKSYKVNNRWLPSQGAQLQKILFFPSLMMLKL